MPRNCIICGNNVTKIDFRLDYCVSSDAKMIRHAISHSYCEICAYLFVDEENRIEYQTFYKDDYDFLLDGDVEPIIGDVKYSDYLVEFYSEYIPINQKATLFDIGGGKGNFVNALYEKFPSLEYTVLEPSKSFEILKKKSFIHKLYNDFFDPKNFDNKYNFLSLIGVLEHVVNPKKFLLDIKTLMDRESYLLIEIPNFKNNKADLLTIDHISKFTEESIKNLFFSAGYEIVKQQVLSTVPMQFIVKIGFQKGLKKIDINKNINNASKYLTQAFQDAEDVSEEKISIYGQGLILEYLLGLGVLKLENIVCIIEDNPLYQGKKWKNKLRIVDFETFEEKYKTNKIYLAMNDCYHQKVLKKLDKYKVLGSIK
ncbi:MAG: hypothetical protein COA44_03575 [Arcobacter sp.]|nr:MAG: hypothetical protein COA44_03575 [Arcobacter sp.]